MLQKISWALLLGTFMAQAGGYGPDHYVAPFWTGEYPSAVSVVKPGVKVLGRSQMNKDEKPSISCELPYGAVLTPWNQERNMKNSVRYLTVSRIHPLVAKKDFDFDTGEKTIAIKRGKVIEYLVYLAEGAFLVRIDGVEYEADQSLFDHVTDAGFLAQEDRWLELNCVNGVRALLAYDDLFDSAGEDADRSLVEGLRAGYGPALIDYGSVRDLTDKEAEELSKP